MQFYTFEIKPDINGGFNINWRFDGAEREDVDQGPHPSGFWHCPLSKVEQEGFYGCINILIDTMIKARQNKIRALQNDIKNLKKEKYLNSRNNSKMGA